MSNAYRVVVLLCLASASACEEIPTPTATQVCLPFLSGKAELCEPTLCVERAETITWHQPAGPGFVARSACPNAAVLAVDGSPLSSYEISYDFRGPDGPNVYFTVGGDVCSGPLTVESLRANLKRADASGGVNGPSGRAGNGGGPVAASDVEFVSLTGGLLHVRLTPRFDKVTYNSGVFDCVATSGNIPTPVTCSCRYGSAPLTQTYDMLLPLPAPPGT